MAGLGLSDDLVARVLGGNAMTVYHGLDPSPGGTA